MDEKKLEETARKAHTVIRDKDGKIEKIVRHINGIREEIHNVDLDKKNTTRCQN